MYFGTEITVPNSWTDLHYCFTKENKYTFYTTKGMDIIVTLTSAYFITASVQIHGEYWYDYEFCDGVTSASIYTIKFSHF